MRAWTNIEYTCIYTRVCVCVYMCMCVNGNYKRTIYAKQEAPKFKFCDGRNCLPRSPSSLVYIFLFF